MFSKILTEAAKNKPQEDTDHEKNVLADLKAKQKRQELAEKQNKNPGEYFIKKLGDLKPAPIIEAYFDIYGDWPKGYPPESY